MSGYDIIFENAIKYKDKALFDRTLAGLSSLRKEKILKIKSESEARLSMAAGVLLERELKRRGYDPDNICIGEKGKPEIKNGEIFFNLSHSYEAAVLVLSDEPIGVDMENLNRRFKTEGIAKRYFSDEENKNIREASDPEKRFLEIWTQKEAYGKFKGGGIADALDFFVDRAEELGVVMDHPAAVFPDALSGEILLKDYIVSVCRYKK